MDIENIVVGMAEIVLGTKVVVTTGVGRGVG